MVIVPQDGCSSWAGGLAGLQARHLGRTAATRFLAVLLIGAVVFGLRRRRCLSARIIRSL
jgi:hypothetical protein